MYMTKLHDFYSGEILHSELDKFFFEEKESKSAIERTKFLVKFP